MESIGNHAFYQCQNMTEAIIGESVELIGKSGFQGCNLKSVTIKGSKLTVKDDAFYCRSLEQAHFHSIEALCGIYFANANANPLNYAHHLFINGKEITELVVPNSVKTIGDYVFRNCYYLTSVKISDKVTSIGTQAFSHCSSLKSVSLSSSLTFIGQSAFNGCNITSIVLPSSVTSIG